MSNRQRIEEFKEACNNWSELCVQLSREVRALNKRVWELEQSKLRTQVRSEERRVGKECRSCRQQQD